MGSHDETPGLDVNFDILEHLDISGYIKDDLEKAVVAVAGHLGDKVRSLLIYGSLARGEWQPASSDVNLCVVMEEMDYEALEPVQEILSKARRRARVVTLVLTLTDLAEATDVFPIKFDDMKRHHILLGGEDVFEDLVVEPRDLAFVAEFKLRNVEWRLRQAFIGSFGDRGWEAQLLLTHFSSAMFPLRAACRIMGYETPNSTDDAIATIERALNYDAGVLRALKQLHKTRAQLSQADVTKLYLDFSRFIHHAVDKVNVLNR